MALVFQIRNAKLEKAHKNIVVSTGAVVDADTSGINMFSVCEGGSLTRIQIV